MTSGVCYSQYLLLMVLDKKEILMLAKIYNRNINLQSLFIINIFEGSLFHIVYKKSADMYEVGCNVSVTKNSNSWKIVYNSCYSMF